MALEDYQLHLYYYNQHRNRFNRKAGRHFRMFRLKIGKRVQLVSTIEQTKA